AGRSVGEALERRLGITDAFKRRGEIAADAAVARATRVMPAAQLGGLLVNLERLLRLGGEDQVAVADQAGAEVVKESDLIFQLLSVDRFLAEDQHRLQ